MRTGQRIAEGAGDILRAVGTGKARCCGLDVTSHLHDAVGAGQRGIHAGQQRVGAGRNAAAGSDGYRLARGKCISVWLGAARAAAGRHDHAGGIGSISEVGVVGRDLGLIAGDQRVDLAPVGIGRREGAGRWVLLVGCEHVAGAAGAGHVFGGIDIAAAAEVELCAGLGRHVGAEQADRFARGR